MARPWLSTHVDSHYTKRIEAVGESPFTGIGMDTREPQIRRCARKKLIPHSGIRVLLRAVGGRGRAPYARALG